MEKLLRDGHWAAHDENIQRAGAKSPIMRGKVTALTRVLTKTTRAGTALKKSRTRGVRATKPGTTPSLAPVEHGRIWG
jgi:hypothetical protein